MAFSSANATVIGQIGANLRVGPGIDKIILLTIPRGAAIVVFPDFQETVGGHTWIGAWYPAAKRGGYVAKTNLSIESAKGKAIGIHVAGNGNIGDLVGVAERLYKAGKPIPALTIVSDPGLCAAIKTVSPTTIIFYRWVAGTSDPGPFDNLRDDGSGSVADPEQWFNLMFERHSQAIGADVHQLYNECSFANNTQSVEYARRVGEFELQLMKVANAHGKKVTFGNYYVGTPEKRHVDAMRPAYTFAAAWGHWLNYHGYTSNADDSSFNSVVNGENTAPFFSLRWVPFVEPYPGLKVLLGEAAPFNSPRYRGTDKLLQYMTELDDQLKPLRAAGREAFATYWTIRGQLDVNWKADDFTHDLLAYESWMKR